MRWRPLALLPVALAVLSAADIHSRTIDRSLVDERFGRVQRDNISRASVLREIFAEAGCIEHFVEQPVKGSKLSNMICTLPGSSEQTVVVSAHYDKVNAGEGALDNWSGASLLPSLYEGLSGVPRRLTYVFALFCDEEKGLVGSRFFVGHLSKEERHNIGADINIDSIGLPGAINIWAARADRELQNAAALVASSLQIQVRGFSFDNRADSDSHPFVDARIPVIDFHSLTQKTLPLLHTPKDVRSAIDSATYYDTYKLLSALLAYLDARHTE